MSAFFAFEKANGEETRSRILYEFRNRLELPAWAPENQAYIGAQGFMSFIQTSREIAFGCIQGYAFFSAVFIVYASR